MMEEPKSIKHFIYSGSVKEVDKMKLQIKYINLPKQWKTI